jgi:hypothetical protein
MLCAWSNKKYKNCAFQLQMAEQPKCESSTRKRPGEVPGSGPDLDPSEEPMDTEDPSATALEHVKNNQKKMKVSDSTEDSPKLPVNFFKTKSRIYF